MNAKDKNRAYLSSRISLKASVRTDMLSVKSRMSYYPATRQLATGTRLTYLLDGEEQTDRFHVLELETDRITLTTHSATSPTYFLRESVLRLMSVSMILSEDYDIDLHGLMPYMIHVLSNSDALVHETGPINFNREADIILSKRVIELLGQRSRLESTGSELKQRLISTVSSLILCKYRNGFERTSISKELGVGQEIIDEAINDLRSRGYRAIRSNSGGFEMVSL